MRPGAVRLDEHEGEEVTVEGTVSRVIHAHILVVIPDKRPVYVDLPDWGQIVCYVKEKLPELATVRLTGRVLRAGGGPPGSKAAGFIEHQLDVSRAEVLARP